MRGGKEERVRAGAANMRYMARAPSAMIRALRAWRYAMPAKAMPRRAAAFSCDAYDAARKMLLVSMLMLPMPRRYDAIHFFFHGAPC